MPMISDLRTHAMASDRQYTPAQLVEPAKLPPELE